jgi:hypothetical protein
MIFPPPQRFSTSGEECSLTLSKCTVPAKLQPIHRYFRTTLLCGPAAASLADDQLANHPQLGLQHVGSPLHKYSVEDYIIN